MTPTTKVLAGVAVAALAATGVAAVVNYRLGRGLDPRGRAHLHELDARLSMAADSGGGTSTSRIGRVLESLQRGQGISVERLRRWVVGLTRGTLSADQASVAESDFGALEKEADRGNV